MSRIESLFWGMTNFGLFPKIKRQPRGFARDDLAMSGDWQKVGADIKKSLKNKSQHGKTVRHAD